MSDDWLGCRVSLDCGGLGHFQGVISKVSLDSHHVTLKNPFQNGIPCKFAEITLGADDIQDLVILEKKSEIEAAGAKSKQGKQSTVLEVKKQKQNQKHTVKRQDSREKVEDGSGGGGTGHPRDAAGFQPLMSLILDNNQKPGYRTSPKKELRSRTPNTRNNGGGGYGGGYGGARTPNRTERFRMKDEDCFSPSVLDMNEEFDFEKNLAMFDKPGVMAEIEQELSNKPDIIRLVDTNLRKPEPKYRNDENVLGNQKTEYRQIETGEVMETEYTTDAGLIVPAISLQLRENLVQALQDHGFDVSKQSELMARAATDLCLQLIGGAHRLAANNTHQLPLAVILCGASKSAVYGVSTARHLAGHGVRTQIYLPESMGRLDNSLLLEQELRLYRLTGGKVVTKGKDLPKTSVDVIVNALEDEEMCVQQRIQPWHRAAVAWASGLKAPVLALDPPPEIPVLVPRMSLVGLLPLAHPAKCGQLYLANLAVPKNLFKEVGIKYSSPFGSKFVISLHASS